jgi:hypothetical protein
LFVCLVGLGTVVGKTVAYFSIFLCCQGQDFLVGVLCFLAVAGISVWPSPNKYIFERRPDRHGFIFYFRVIVAFSNDRFLLSCLSISLPLRSFSNKDRHDTTTTATTKQAPIVTVGQTAIPFTTLITEANYSVSGRLIELTTKKRTSTTMPISRHHSKNSDGFPGLRTLVKTRMLKDVFDMASGEFCSCLFYEMITLVLF